MPEPLMEESLFLEWLHFELTFKEFHQSLILFLIKVFLKLALGYE